MLKYPQQPEGTSREVRQQKNGWKGFLSPQRKTELCCFQKVDAAGDQIKQIRWDSERYILACFMLYNIYIYMQKQKWNCLEKSKLLGRGGAKGEVGGWGRSQLNLEPRFVWKIKKITRKPGFLSSSFTLLLFAYIMQYRLLIVHRNITSSILEVSTPFPQPKVFNHIPFS